MRLTVSKTGLIFGGGFLVLVAAAVIYVIYSATQNPGDSGESGILILVFALPWLAIVGQNVGGEALLWIMVGFNAFLLYLFGSLLDWLVGRIKNARV